MRRLRGKPLSKQGLNEIQYQYPCTPLKIATSDTRRPNPENSAIDASWLRSKRSEEVVGAEYVREMRTVFCNSTFGI